jgi:hypothetical protein
MIKPAVLDSLQTPTNPNGNRGATSGQRTIDANEKHHSWKARREACGTGPKQEDLGQLCKKPGRGLFLFGRPSKPSKLSLWKSLAAASDACFRRGYAMLPHSYSASLHLREPCGAIITACAIIGLGYIASGVGSRYASLRIVDAGAISYIETEPAQVRASDANGVDVMGLLLSEMAFFQCWTGSSQLRRNISSAHCFQSDYAKGFRIEVLVTVARLCS